MNQKSFNKRLLYLFIFHVQLHFSWVVKLKLMTFDAFVLKNQILRTDVSDIYNIDSCTSKHTN